MGLVDHEERNPVSDVAEYFRDESFVREALWRDQENIDVVASDALLNRGPVSLVVRVNGSGANTHPLCGGYLITHQSEQRGDKHRGTATGLAEQLGRNEVDEALAPSGFLHDEKPTATLDDVSNRVLLAVTKSRIAYPGAEPKKAQRTVVVVGHLPGHAFTEHMPQLNRRWTGGIRSEMINRYLQVHSEHGHLTMQLARRAGFLF